MPGQCIILKELFVNIVYLVAAKHKYINFPITEINQHGINMGGNKAKSNFSNFCKQYLRICWLKVSFCSSDKREEGKPGDCRASLSQTVSRPKQCLFMENSTSAN